MISPSHVPPKQDGQGKKVQEIIFSRAQEPKIDFDIRNLFWPPVRVPYLRITRLRITRSRLIPDRGFNYVAGLNRGSDQNPRGGPKRPPRWSPVAIRTRIKGAVYEMGSYRAAWTAGSFLAGSYAALERLIFAAAIGADPQTKCRIPGRASMLWAAGIGRAASSRNHINAHHGVGAGVSCTSTPGPHRRAKDAAGIKHPRGSRQGGARPPNRPNST